MPVPKRKRSKSRRDKRFANKGIKVKAFTQCKQCLAPLVSHVVCKECGFYKGKKIIVTKVDRAQKRVETVQLRKQKQARSENKDTSKNAD